MLNFVLKKRNKCWYPGPDGKEHKLEQGSIERLGEVYIAVLTFSSPGAYEVASIGDIKKVKHDQSIYVAGFPLNNSQDLRHEKGEVVGNAEFGIDQGYQLFYSNKTLPGMSGGVLLNCVRKMLSHGARRSDIVAFAAKEWGVKPRTADDYIGDANKDIIQDFKIERQQYTAQLLKVLHTVMEKGTSTN